MVAGLALLTKQTALLLLPLGALAVALQADWRALRAVNWHKLLADAAAFALAALAVGGWWYARNAALYGDALGLSAHLQTQVPLPHPFGLVDVLHILQSYIGAFGWTMLMLKPWIYAASGGVALIALGGLALAFRPGGSFRQAPADVRRGLALLAVALILNTAALVRWSIDTGAPYGRLLYPSAAVIALFTAWGFAEWQRWIGWRGLRWVHAVLAAAALALAATIPLWVLRPAFAAPRVAGDLPASVQRIDVRFANGIRLIGYHAPSGDLRLGQGIDMTLYWRADAVPQARYHVWAQIGPWNAFPPLDEVDTWLGGTRYPTDLWEPGDVVQQTYHLTVPDWAAAPRLYWLRAGMTDESGARIALAQPDAALALGPWDPTGGQAAVIGPWRLPG